MDSSPSTSTRAAEPRLPTVAGVKRPAPSLLPAFEPLSSSPALPRPSKRHASSHAFLKYPTPVPTSSTGILSSSPPRLGSRPVPQRRQSTLSERAPLSSVPSVELNENGETVLMGRSSSSSNYQLSANRLISRVHVKARYVAATNPLEPNKIEIICNGWNGLKLHCQGQTWELAKGDSFTSETEGAELMVDVQDARVFVRWPRRDKDQDALGHLSDSTWDESPRPRIPRAGSELHGSPLRRTTRLASPESPTPANVSTSNASLDSLMPRGGEDDDAPVEIYEDASADEKSPQRPKSRNAAASFMTQVAESFSSDLSDPASDGENDLNEENDPILHSFGPFGPNISSRLASFSAMTPRKPAVPRNPLADVLESSPLPAPSPLGPADANSTASAHPDNDAEPASLAGLAPEAISTITNHMINQLAFSRLSSTPLSTIMNNLPAEERRAVTRDQLRAIIESTPCVGIIRRQGKDAAGKPLESEYYYTPELDTDEHRRVAVTDGLRKPSLRNCRKQHKQYYWKRPKTP
ncbi:hypothetical protein C8A01DRAFT_45262 [Parachaetomium inaequale]|uniref:FHA domain-containing protein n=1 Tax=Parachaetomium inaequale TaxID=2588326 RepID=A0AAN6STE1_9PEZI|nr:hypothetical protein C8A01DRAFT_45262 [Parachaetomium inaequale]